jgi:hypothetical protein
MFQRTREKNVLKRATQAGKVWRERMPQRIAL